MHPSIAGPGAQIVSTRHTSGRAKYFVVDQLQLILVQRELLDWP